MSLGFHMYQEQSQRLVMTTQMKQAIELLQCSALELNAYVEEWVDGNPFIEYEPVAYQLQDAWQEPSRRNDRGSGQHATEEPSILEQTVSYEPSLLEKLDAQICVVNAPHEVVRAARFLLGCLDESGYLREAREDICACLHISDATYEAAVTLVQTCDPLGIGARSLTECLRLQLDLVPMHLRPIVSELIEHHLNEVANGKLPVIARQLHIPVSVVQQAVDALKKLNPRPGISLASSSAEYVVPDVLVRRVGRDYVVMTNEHAEPHVRLHEGYLSMQSNAELATMEYLQKKALAARWLVRCLEQRRITLYRVAEAIVQRQSAFFDRGASAMRPMTLRDIADDVGLHESTVSRATRGKYMLTPRGLLEMKFFFSAEVNTVEGVTSSNAAKHVIRTQIELEDGNHPLSDDALTRALANHGIRISRRTVAKYREEMEIPPSWRRRRYDA